MLLLLLCSIILSNIWFESIKIDDLRCFEFFGEKLILRLFCFTYDRLFRILPLLDSEVRLVELPSPKELSFIMLFLLDYVSLSWVFSFFMNRLGLMAFSLFVLSNVNASNLLAIFIIVFILWILVFAWLCSKIDLKYFNPAPDFFSDCFFFGSTGQMPKYGNFLCLNGPIFSGAIYFVWRGLWF